MPINWGDVFLTHYERYFGALLHGAVFRASDEMPAIQVIEVKRGIPGCRTFCTLGLSHFNERIGQVGELYMPVDDGFDVVPRLLAEASFLMATDGVRFGRGTAFTGIERISRSFVELWKKSAIYLSMPLDCPPGFESVAVSGETGYMLLAILISAEEFLYIQKYGAEQFEDLLEKHGVDPYDVARPSVV